MNCNCENKTSSLDEIPLQDCPFNLKQIQRLAFVKSGRVVWDSATGGGAGEGLPLATSQLDTKADWDARRTAQDETKIVLTPRIGGDPVINAGDVITKGGGGNDTFNGVKQVEGVSPAEFSCKFLSLAVKVERALKKLGCEDLEVYFITQGGYIVGSQKEGETKITGFNVLSMFFSDRTNEGYGTSDFNTLSFSLEAGYSENLIQVKPKDFDAIYGLKIA